MTLNSKPIQEMRSFPKNADTKPHPKGLGQSLARVIICG